MLEKVVQVLRHFIQNRLKQFFHGHWSCKEVFISGTCKIFMPVLAHLVLKPELHRFEEGEFWLFHPRKLGVLVFSSQTHLLSEAILLGGFQGRFSLGKFRKLLKK